MVAMHSIAFCVVVCSLGFYCCDPWEDVTDIVEPEQEATSAIIFLHGAGGSGPQIRKHVESHIGNFSQFHNTRLIFPTANAVENSAFPWNGQIVNIWFSLNTLDINYIANTTDMVNSAKKIERLIEQQVASGIPHRNICLVGYSSGGMMSIYFGYGYIKNLGCIGAISAHISSDSDIYKEIPVQNNNSCMRLPPLYMYAGGLDFIIWASYIKETAYKLEKIGVPVTYKYQWSGTHIPNKHSVQSLFHFIKESIL